MASPSVLKFNDPYGAERVMIALQGMQAAGEVDHPGGRGYPPSWPQGNRKPKTRELHVAGARAGVRSGAS